MSLLVAMMVAQFFFVTFYLPVQLVDERVDGGVHSGSGGVGMQLPSGDVHRGLGALGPVPRLQGDIHVGYVIEMPLEFLQLGRNVASQPLADIEMLTADVHLHEVIGASWLGREVALVCGRRRLGRNIASLRHLPMVRFDAGDAPRTKVPLPAFTPTAMSDRVLPPPAAMGEL